MRLNVEFVSYILGQRTREVTRFLEGGDELKLTMLHSVLDVITNYTSPGTEVTWLATSSFRKIKSLLKNSDPYREIKLAEKDLSSTFYRKYVVGFLEKLEAEEAVELLLKASALGDSIRTLYDSVDHVESQFQRLRELRLEGAPVKEFLEKAEGKRVGLVLNNVGGVVFDLELAGLLSRSFSSIVKLYVKTDAYANDITFDMLTSHYRVPDEIHVIPLVGDAAGIDKSLLRKSDLDELWSNDVLLVKGIMNYCGLKNSGYNGVSYSLLYVPFRDLAEKLGVAWKTPVLIRVA